MAERILASDSGRKQVSPGEFVEANIDVAMVHEALGVSGGVADVIVAGRNFGCGSSREEAPVLLKRLGVSVITAAGFARLFSGIR